MRRPQEAEAGRSRCSVPSRANRPQARSAVFRGYGGVRLDQPVLAGIGDSPAESEVHGAGRGARGCAPSAGAPAPPCRPGRRNPLPGAGAGEAGPPAGPGGRPSRGRLPLASFRPAVRLPDRPAAVLLIEELSACGNRRRSRRVGSARAVPGTPGASRCRGGGTGPRPAAARAAPRAARSGSSATARRRCPRSPSRRQRRARWPGRTPTRPRASGASSLVSCCRARPGALGGSDGAAPADRYVRRTLMRRQLAIRESFASTADPRDPGPSAAFSVSRRGHGSCAGVAVVAGVVLAVCLLRAGQLRTWWRTQRVGLEPRAGRRLLGRDFGPRFPSGPFPVPAQDRLDALARPLDRRGRCVDGIVVLILADPCEPGVRRSRSVTRPAKVDSSPDLLDTGGDPLRILSPASRAVSSSSLRSWLVTKL